ncbi:SGNH/GDSL hydrolase family protein [Nocardioides conyzicola]|uniref:SGNH/GDSL hydrolase family protein n=1 Tax=Nocardioides conyzicola TaxID=1651781 RepID=A0ABP8Y2E6_9ACTN
MRMRQGSGRGDDGQSTVEYIGLGVVISALIGTLLATGPGVLDRAQAAVDAVYCSIAGNAGCGDQASAGPRAAANDPTGGSPTGPDAAPSATTSTYAPEPLTPRGIAESGDYVALGDSYSSGEGAYDYQPGTDQDNNRCHRSGNAYGQQVYNGGNFAGGFSFGACSGGVVEDYFGPNQENVGEQPQRDLITENTSLITISMGGNDFGFADVLSHCVFHGCANDAYLAQLRDRIAAESDQLVEMYRDMRERAGDGTRIVVVGYPHLFDVDGNHGLSLSSPITAAERRFLNNMSDMANQAIRGSIAKADSGIEFVDIRGAYAGHEIGTDDPWIHDLSLHWDWGNTGPNPSSFHPTQAGQNAIRDAVNHQIDEGP